MGLIARRCELKKKVSTKKNQVSGLMNLIDKYQKRNKSSSFDLQRNVGERRDSPTLLKSE